MTTSTLISEKQNLNSKSVTNEFINENTKEAFMNDFQEFAIEDDMEQFNLDFMDEIDPLFS